MKRPHFWILISLVVSSLFLWVIGPWLSESVGAPTTNGVYMLLRVILGVALGFVLKHFCQIPRTQVLFLAGFVGFLDQCVLKLLWVATDQRLHPERWPNLPPMGSFAIQLGVSFIFLCPIILVLGFLGHELASFLHEKKSRTQT